MTEPSVAREPAAEPPAGRPRVIVEFLFERGMLHVGVRNIGDLPAHDVVVAFDGKLNGLGGRRDVGAQALFRDLAFLGPGRELFTLLDESGAWFARREPTRVRAEIRYHDGAGRRFVDAATHNLDVFRELAYIAGEAGIASTRGA